MDYDVIVIGAGCGGLSAGALMARNGYKVLVVEQSSLVGGCCSTFEKDGFHFDLGASIVELMPPFQEFFRRMGTSVEQELDLIACDPVYHFMTKDGSCFTSPLSSTENAKLIAKLSPEDARSWEKFDHDMTDFIDRICKYFFTMPCNSVADMVRMFAKSGLWKYMSFFNGSYQEVLSKYFHNDIVKESMAFQCFYAGLPPELCGGHYALLPFAEHLGVYYPRGGMIQIPLAMQRCGEREGMEVRLNTRVKQVMVKQGEVTGIRLADGTEITSSIVVANINAKVLYLDLIGEEHLPRRVIKGINSYELSMSTPMIYLGLDYRPPLEAHHTLVTLPMDEINDYWWNKYKRGIFPDEQFGILCSPTVSDPSLAPEGHHILNLTLAPGPYKLAHTNWDEAKEGIMERVINHFSDKYVPGLKDHVVTSAFTTPLDFERRLLTPEGAIYALSQYVPQSTIFRPAAKSKAIKGLYLAGASTHPGGGVPTVVASGIIAADLIEKYEVSSSTRMFTQPGIDMLS